MNLHDSLMVTCLLALAFQPAARGDERPWPSETYATAPGLTIDESQLSSTRNDDTQQLRRLLQRQQQEMLRQEVRIERLESQLWPPSSQSGFQSGFQRGGANGPLLKAGIRHQYRRVVRRTRRSIFRKSPFHTPAKAVIQLAIRNSRSVQNCGLGLFTAQVAFDYEINECLSATLAAGWLNSDEPNPTSGSRDMGTEILKMFTYDFGDGLKADLGAAVLFTGDFFKPSPASPSPDTLWEAFTRVQLEF